MPSLDKIDEVKSPVYRDVLSKSPKSVCDTAQEQPRQVEMVVTDFADKPVPQPLGSENHAAAGKKKCWASLFCCNAKRI
jgi:hypothetical protein